MTINDIKTPSYVIDEDKLIKNLEILQYVQEQSKAKILLAQKAFSAYSMYPLMSKYLAGTSASGLFEAKLGYEEMPNKEVHVFSPAYGEEEIRELVTFCDHIVFNSPAQWNRFKDVVKASGRDIKCGIRINPEYSEIETDIYNPCIVGSRLGTVKSIIDEADIEGISGLHFHTLCEQGADVLARTLDVVEEKFADYLDKLEWINLGGGHHITREDYDVELLISRIKRLKERFNVDVYLEPGEAVALNAGYLVSEVRELMENGMNIAILDTSAACHMPDVIEMPYRPNIIDAGMPKEKAFTYRFGGPTCLAGDIIGDYSFDKPLKVGDRLVFLDMAIYSMVKNNTFNGMPLPSIAVKRGEDVTVIKEFSYEDFKCRL
ncbi:MAG: carboxynorspermidine decarboxylase [Lachnospiraceae bacterium]|nr:carboxynorspermidine decarboxylase [Lachnospiraceae bacterium]